MEGERLLWFLGGLSALMLELFSYFYYQLYLGLKPCEFCVLIRLSMWGIALGGFLGAIYPKFIPLKILAYAVALANSIWGLKLSIALEMINIESQLPDYFSPCTLGKVSFPFGIPFDKFFPAHFYPSGTCGEDSLWSFFDFTMPELLLMVYIVYIVGLLLMLTASILKGIESVRNDTDK
jgi:disulfide bond formation protein DsbB